MGDGVSDGTAALLQVLNADQLRAWRKQREQLRSNYRQLWGVSSDQFRQRWCGESRPEVLIAMSLAAREDIENGNTHLALLLDALLPELAVLVGRLAQRIEGPQTTEDEEKEKEEKADDQEGFSSTSKEDSLAKEEEQDIDLCDIMTRAAENRDVETSQFSVASVDSYVQSLTDDESTRQTAREALLVGRSCVLLQFCTCMLLLVMADATEPPGTAS